MAAQPPFASRLNDTGTLLANPCTPQNGFLQRPINGERVLHQPHYRLGYTQTWTVSLTAELCRTMCSWSWNTSASRAPDSSHSAAQSTDHPGRQQAPIRIPNASSFSYLTSIANSTMNAAQVRLTRRFTRGLSAVALYTFSKSIDDDSNQAQDPFNLQPGAARFPSGDQRHRFEREVYGSSPVGNSRFMAEWRLENQSLLSGWTDPGGFTYAPVAPLTPPSLASLVSSSNTTCGPT